MTVRFTRGNGKPDTLACVRQDGTVTWVALNSALHDIGHYAIETVLGWRGAFFGLLAQGWDIADFGRIDPLTGVKPAIPPQAGQAEALAGLLDMERRSGLPPPSHSAFTELLVSACGGLGLPVPAVSSDDLDAIRVRFAAVRRDWEAVPPGGDLELSF